MKSKIRRKYDHITWRRWFAWFPVKVDVEFTENKWYTRWVWFKTIEKCNILEGLYYSYRFIDEKSKTKSS